MESPNSLRRNGEKKREREERRRRMKGKEGRKKGEYFNILSKPGAGKRRGRKKKNNSCREWKEKRGGTRKHARRIKIRIEEGRRNLDVGVSARKIFAFSFPSSSKRWLEKLKKKKEQSERLMRRTSFSSRERENFWKSSTSVTNLRFTPPRDLGKNIFGNAVKRVEIRQIYPLKRASLGLFRFP